MTTLASRVSYKTMGVLLLLLFPGLAGAATTIYRSIGPGATAALDNYSSNTLTISGTDAFFTAAVANTVGVGDIIEYDTDGDLVADALAVVTGRVSSTHYLVSSTTGGVPQPLSVSGRRWYIFRAYLSLANAAQGIENTGILAALRDFDAGGHDLTAADEVWHFACYNSAADAASASWGAWTTGSDQYIHIYTPTLANEAGADQRHAGAWNAAYYYMQVTDNTAILLEGQARHIRLDGLQIHIASVTGDSCCAVRVNTAGPADVEITDCIFVGDHATTGYRHDAVLACQTSGGQVRIGNSIFYDFGGAGIEADCPGGQVLAYNTTVENCITSYRQVRGDFCAKNALAQDGTTGFAGVFNAASDYNLSNLTDAPGGHSRLDVVTYQNKLNNNFHLRSDDTAAMDYGQNLSADALWALSGDIDLQYRYSAWDIGADEFYAAGYVSPTVTLTGTPTPSATPTRTPTASPTPTSTPTPSSTASPTPTASPTFFASATPTLTATPTISATRTQTATVTPTATFSPTATISATRTASLTCTPTRTVTATPSETPTSSTTTTSTQTLTCTVSPTPSISATRTASLTPVISPTLTATETVTVAPTASGTPTVFALPVGEVITYPQPASGGVLYFYFRTPAPASASIQIYNLMGEQVAVLPQACDGVTYARTPWNLNPVAPGIYLYRIKISYGDREQATPWHKLVVVKK